MQRPGRRRLLTAALLGIGLSAALVTSACETNATAGEDRNPGKATKPASSAESAGSGSSIQGGLPQGSESVKLDPADFTTRIDNPYWPMKPGNRWVYRETDPEGTVLRVVVRV